MDLPESLVVPHYASSERADRALAEHLPGDLSRASTARLIRDGRVLLRGSPVKPSTIVSPGDELKILPGEPVVRDSPVKEAPAFEILFEDDHVIVLDKPPGLVVHPGAGHRTGTLMDSLVETRPEMIGVGDPGRWGIVHRLDKDTSGVMVVARTKPARAGLSIQFKDHTVHRVYMALVRGQPGHESGLIESPIGRHQRDRKRMSVASASGRYAATDWTVMKRYRELTLLEVRPRTGRTHQIRVHLASTGLPVAGDPLYGRMRKSGGIKDPSARKALALLKRQALHAACLGFQHPIQQQYLEFTAPFPPDLKQVLSTLDMGVMEHARES